MLSLLLVALLAPQGCPTSQVDGAKMYAAGQAAKAAGMQGEHLSTRGFEVASKAYKAAAEAGHRDAQFAFGGLVISTTYMKAGVQPKQKALYIEALTWLAVAALRGDRKALTYLPPGVTGELIGTPVEQEAEQAFSDIPKAWLIEARDNAKRLAKCWQAKSAPFKLHMNAPFK